MTQIILAVLIGFMFCCCYWAGQRNSWPAYFVFLMVGSVCIAALLREIAR